MMTAARPRRSMLYMPGSNARALEKGRSLKADALILDLEDAVAPDAKVEARRLVSEALAAGGYGGREILVRTNGLNSPWGVADVVAAARSGAHGVLLPKVESADTVRQVAAILAAEGAPADQAIWCMMETPRGILHAEEIADAPRMGGFVLGTSDLTKDLQAHHTLDRLPMQASLAICLLAARAAGIACIDGVHLDLEDAAGLQSACRQGADMGFDGKSLIHPRQIDAANDAFRPSEDELVWSRRIIDAHGEAEASGAGVVVVDGRLVENLHVENAKRIVKLAEQITALEKASG
ncbi:MAG: CoA ester lyase [Alphaproteobacteria bacterium]